MCGFSLSYQASFSGLYEAAPRGWWQHQGPGTASSEVTRNTSGGRPSPRPSPYFPLRRIYKYIKSISQYVFVCLPPGGGWPRRGARHQARPVPERSLAAPAPPAAAARWRGWAAELRRKINPNPKQLYQPPEPAIPALRLNDVF